MWSRAVVRTRHRCPRGRSNYAGRMLLAEELILLLLDDDSGRWLVRRRAVRQAVRVALVFELVADRALFVGGAGRLANGIPGMVDADPVRARVVAEAVGHRPEELTRPPRAETADLLRRLRERGVVRRSLLRPSRHLPRDAHPEAGVRARLLEALTVQLRPDRHTALLVAIVYELDLLGRLFPDQDTLELSLRAATIVSDLREDQHYGRTALEQEAARAAGDGSASTTSWVGDAMDVLDAMGNLLELVALPFRLARIIGDLLP